MRTTHGSRCTEKAVCVMCSMLCSASSSSKGAGCGSGCMLQQLLTHALSSSGGSGRVTPGLVVLLVSSCSCCEGWLGVTKSVPGSWQLLSCVWVCCACSSAGALLLQPSLILYQQT